MAQEALDRDVRRGHFRTRPALPFGSGWVRVARYVCSATNPA